jgi:hypothetical protein
VGNAFGDFGGDWIGEPCGRRRTKKSKPNAFFYRSFVFFVSHHQQEKMMWKSEGAIEAKVHGLMLSERC